MLRLKKNIFNKKNWQKIGGSLLKLPQVSGKTFHNIDF
jgi:hypothetical protein